MTAFLFGLFAGSSAAADIAVGPFVIESGTKRISSGAFPNTSGNPFSRMSVSDFRVSHRGKTIAVGDDKTRTDRFWDARVLRGAPSPAVLVATTGAWLLSEADGKLDVKTLIAPSTDSVRWQWLDSNNGQPGPEQAFTIRDSSAEPREISDGRVLLIGRRGILAVDTLRWWPLPVTDSTILRKLDGFNAGNAEVRALSPGRTQVVLVGDRRIGDFFEFALTVFDYAAGSAYPVPFDSNALRFDSVWDATPSWLASYFEWTRDASGSERIRLRTPVHSLPWQGRFSRNHGDVEYKLHPATAGLVAPLRVLIEGELAAKRVAPPYGDPSDPHAISYDAAGRRFRLWFDPPRRTLSVFAERINGFVVEGTQAAIERIGTRFNEILATGAHQREFSTYLDHR